MSTATGLRYPSETADESPDLLPIRIPVENQKGSEFNQSDLGDIAKFPVAPMYLSQLKGKFKLLQLWEGRVIDIRNDEFDAIISDKTNTDYSDELVTIDLMEITPDDQPLLKKGAVFYWSVGYLDYPGRGRVRESKMRFRRLKGWTEKEIKRAKTIGKQFAQFFEQNSVRSPQI